MKPALMNFGFAPPAFRRKRDNGLNALQIWKSRDNSIARTTALAHFPAVRLISSANVMQRQALAWRRAGVRIAFVPTMGYLHSGHASLMQRARRIVGPAGKLVVSIYVNPAQFGPQEDLSRYPRDLPGDKALCSRMGVDCVFVPGTDEMYPPDKIGNHSTYVLETRVSSSMEGSSRPTHFRGVATIVAKLFNLVLPEVAVFGAKDFQQAAAIRKMTADLNFPVRIVVAPTIREPDGLALSSRNNYLSVEERSQAVVLSQALWLVARRVSRCKSGVPASRLKAGVSRMVAARPLASMDYIEFFDPATLEPVQRVIRGTQMALAVFVGKTRLIDNALL